MGTFKITGGKKLNGTITPQGAKNETLQILCAVLLTSEEVRITNIPDIVDVNKLIDLLSDLGVYVKKTVMEIIPSKRKMLILTISPQTPSR